jgi:hypothetical protein
MTGDSVEPTGLVPLGIKQFAVAYRCPNCPSQCKWVVIGDGQIRA